MIVLDPLTGFLFLEGATLLLVILAGIIWVMTRRDLREQQGIRKVIDRLKKAGENHAGELNEILMEIQAFPEDKRREFLATIQALETALYHQIVKLFLQRDTALLGQIDQRVRELSKPYQELLANLPQREDPVMKETLDKAEREIDRLKMETEHLTRQLQVATATVETLSKEYARMFAAGRTQQDIEISRQKILDTLKRSAKHLTGSSENDEEDEDLVITLIDDK